MLPRRFRKDHYHGVEIMSILELRLRVPVALLALAVVMILPACSTTEEEPSPFETGGGSGPCDCVVGDLECKEECLLDLPI